MLNTRRPILAVLLLMFCHSMAGVAKYRGELIMPPKQVNTYVLAIGINQYADPSLHELRFAEADAMAVAKVFADHGACVETLIGASATTKAIGESMARLAAIARKQDTLVVYFAGHSSGKRGGLGRAESVGEASIRHVGTPIWLTFDSRLNRETHDVIGALGWDQLIDILDVCQAGHQLLMQDAAYSPGKGELIAERIRNKAPIRAFMFAGHADELVSEDPVAGHGVFTSALLEGLRGGAFLQASRNVTLLGLSQYVTRRVENLTRGRGVPQILFNAPAENRDFVVVAENAHAKLKRSGGSRFNTEDNLPVSVDLLEVDGKGVAPTKRATSVSPLEVENLRVSVMGRVNGSEERLTIRVGDSEANIYPVGHYRVFTAFPDLIPGLNKLKVVVSDQGIRKRAFEFVVHCSAKKAPPTGVGRNFALVIDTSNYRVITPNLPNPKHDGDELARILRDNYDFTNVERVSDPTRNQLLTKINEEYTKQKFDPHDQLLIFIAGHGSYQDIGRHGMGYLLCSDATRQEPYYQNSTVIKFSELRDSIDNIPCDHILVLIDACFGGTFSDDVTKPRGGPGPSSGDLDRQISRLLTGTTRRYFSSGGKEYVPDGGDDPDHSPFASCIFHTLEQRERRLLTADDIQTALAAMPSKYPVPKAGKFSNDDTGGNFVFLRAP